MSCQLAFAKGESGKSIINYILWLHKRMAAPKLESELIIYDDEHQANLTKLPNWLQEAISDKTEAPPPQSESSGHASQDIPFDDDIPF